MTWSFHENPELDHIIERQRAEFDVPKRKELLFKLQEIAVDEAYMLFLFEDVYAAAMREYVNGIWFDPVGFVHLQDMWMDKS